MDSLIVTLVKVGLMVLAALVAIAFLSGGAGLSFSLAFEMVQRAALPTLIVGFAKWWFLADRGPGGTLMALLPAVAGVVWLAIWPWLDLWGQAAATVPSVLSYTGYVINDADLPWYATDIGQWGGLIACAIMTSAGWMLGRD